MIEKNKPTSDFHVHCGQFYNTYYQPAFIVKALANNGVKNVWLSSTTSCIEWKSKEEKKNILQHIEDEMQESIETSKIYNVNLTPLYWVLPQRYLEGESISDIMDNSVYKGFKIHPQVGGWDKNKKLSETLFNETCIYAQKKSMSILIHTGLDKNDLPNRFEKFFDKYKDVQFVLAHCKDLNGVLKLFAKYQNLYGDTAFCPKINLKRIFDAGYKDRMKFGTDFPITEWFENLGQKNKVHQTDLNKNYKKQLQVFQTYGI